MTKDQAYIEFCGNHLEYPAGSARIAREAFEAGWSAALVALEDAVASPYSSVERGDLEVAIFNLQG